MRYGRLALVAGLCLGATRAAAAEPLSLAVTPAGQLTLTMAGRAVATGDWRPYWHPAEVYPAGELAVGPVVSEVATAVGPASATVVTTYAAARVTCTFTLAGEDLRAVAHVENRDPARTYRRLTFYGLTFHFAHDAAGTMPAWDYSYLAANGFDLFHPSTRSALGCVWATDGRLAVSVFGPTEFNRRSLVNARFDRNVLPAECEPYFYTDRVVPPGGAADVEVRFRVTTDASIPHLLEPYRAVYAAHFPALTYDPDDRPVGQFASMDGRFINPHNPYGYNGEVRRLDTPGGTFAFVNWVAPRLQAAHALGMIFWSPGGYRDPMYPPDFDEFPPAVRANLPKLIAGFKARGLRVGLCARCGDGVTRAAGKPPVVYRLSAGDPDQMRTLLARFKHAEDMGFDMFYLDTFGGDGENDLAILRRLRGAVGPDVLFYTEMCTDMSLPFAGRYCEWEGTSLLWNSVDSLVALKYLCPQSTWLCVSRVPGQLIPPAFARLGLTPLVGDNDVARLPLPGAVGP